MVVKFMLSAPRLITRPEDIWRWLNSPDNNPGVMALMAILALLLPVFMAWRAHRNKSNKLRAGFGSGGRGGSASVAGNGVAIGGQGGRGGLSGSGGDGGSSEVRGSGVAVGGSGGDAGVPWRPVFGGASPLERYSVNPMLRDDLPKDELGMVSVGRGGASGNIAAVVQTELGTMRLLDLLMLINLWSPATIDELDQLKPDNEQDFWELLERKYPDLADRAKRHVIDSLHAKREGKPPPNPYK